MQTEGTIACSLNASEFRDRLAQWQKVTGRATSRRVEPDRIVSTYPRDQMLRIELEKLIAAEAECCSFMNFTVDETHDALVLELRVPDGLAEPLAAMLGPAARSPQEASPR